MDTSTGGIITVVVAAVYGIGFAILPNVLGERWPSMARRYTMIGAGLVALCAVLLVLVPYLSERS